jgi:drug/metabolite transporter (DMT)-like permease
MDNSQLKGHGAMLGAEILWGISAPLGKIILTGGITPLLLTNCRFFGAAILFWLVSFITKPEEVNHRDLLTIFFAALCGVICNQGMFLFGLQLTSPVNASIITTSSPIITMVLAAIVLHEPVTKLKVGGVFLGALGALVLILGSSSAASGGMALGDILVILAQVSFSCYLVFFKRLTARYSAITLMKWMFTYASICAIPFSYGDWIATDWSTLQPAVIWGVVTFVVGPTFISYMLLPVGQKNLRPTVTAMYNYVQPIVASLVAVWMGIGDFTLLKGVAVAFIFTGVFLVTKSKSRADLEAQTLKK